MRVFLKRLYSLVYVACARLLSIGRKRKTKKNDVVTIVKYDGIGDFILFLDAAAAIRKIYRDKKIILTCSSRSAPLARRSGYFDEVIPFERGELFIRNFRRTARRAKALECDLLLHTSFSRDIAAEALASFIPAGKKMSVPYTHLLNIRMEKWGRRIYDEWFDIPLNEMCLVQNAMMVRALGMPDFRCSIPSLPPMDATPKFYLPENYYVICPGGSAYIKKWRSENYFAVAKYVKQHSDIKCVLVGEMHEGELDELFRDRGEVEFYSFVGKTDIDELQYIISRAKFAVGNDTGTTHVAATLGVPYIAISAAVSANRFYPYKTEREGGGVAPVFVRADVECAGCAFSLETFVKCIDGVEYTKKKCIEMIKVEDVIPHVENQLRINGLYKDAADD